MISINIFIAVLTILVFLCVFLIRASYLAGYSAGMKSVGDVVDRACSSLSIKERRAMSKALFNELDRGGKIP